MPTPTDDELRLLHERLQRIAAEDLADRAIRVLQRRFWILTAVLGIATPALCAGLFIWAQQEVVGALQTKADEHSKQLENQAKEQSDQLKKDVDADLSQVKVDVSGVKGDVIRASTLTDKLTNVVKSGLEATATSGSSAGEKKDLEDALGALAETTKAIEVNGHIPVRVVYAENRQADADQAFTKLASAGYATTLAATNFSEVGGVEQGTDRVMVPGADRDLARPVCEVLGLPPTAWKVSARLPAGSVQVWLP